MQVQQAIETFSRYCQQEQSAFLLQVAHALTVIARDTYEDGGEAVAHPTRLRRINEVQHRVISSLIALTQPQVQRYPDAVLLRMLLEHTDDLHLQKQV